MKNSITPEEVQQTIDSDEQVAVIDIREPLDYSFGHIKEGTPVPRRLLESRLLEVVPNKEIPVILCDQSGDRAPIDANWLCTLGYQDVSYIEGGIDAWMSAGLDTVEMQEGVYSTAFNRLSKEFGEQVQVERNVEQIHPDELKELLDDEDEDLLIADVRTPEEHCDMTIPGAVNLQSVDLCLYLNQLRNESQTAVVHCAGRTRSIIGTASLEKLGFENVYELKNGTMGWDLAGYELEKEASRSISKKDLNEVYNPEIESKAESLLTENDIPMISLDEFQDIRDADDRVVYSIDVRTKKEYGEGHIPHTLSIPGGQAIQTADEHIAVRNGTIVFISENHVRSSIVAYWFSEMGFDRVTVFKKGIKAWRDAGLPIKTGQNQEPLAEEAEVEEMVKYASAATVSDIIDLNASKIINVGASMDFKSGHLPGAKWVPRYNLEMWLNNNDIDRDTPIVLTSKQGYIAMYTAAAIQHELNYENVHVLKGGTIRWEESGRPLEQSTDGLEFDPRDEIPLPYQQGDWAKQAYLDWEEELGEKYE
jgi:rhodanese-related sulfurtransferase